MTSLPRVLCVDDEPMLLAALKTSLRRRYEVTTAEGGLEALHLLRERGPFTVVISDFRMPGMDGARFLARARDVAPHAVRILLTGQAGLEDAIEAVNQGYIFRFLTKPCPPNVLLAAIEAAVDQARLATRDRELLECKLEAMSGQLLHAERLATLGTLAGAVGHELSNILVAFDSALHAVSNCAHAARPPAGEDVDTLEVVRKHLATHARQLLHLGRPAGEGEGPSDLCQVVNETLAMLQTAGMLRYVELRLQVPPHPVEVATDRTRLEQVILNLVKNAVDAMAEQDAPAPVLTVEVRLDTEGFASARIADTGCGIPGDKLQLVFEPYYTTKGREKGTGLGLFVVKQIVESSGGMLEVASEVGKGTTFTVRVPAISSAGTSERSGQSKRAAGTLVHNVPG